MKIIMHVDLDSFFASVEERENPSLKEEVLIISWNEKNGIVLTSNKKAKILGIEAGKPVFKYLKEFPHARVVKPNYLLYSSISHDFFSMLREKYSKKLEITSIDECFIDITAYVNKTKRSIEDIAIELLVDVKARLGITCSIGISWNRMFAKIAAQLNKPNGFFEITVDNYKDVLEEKSIKLIPGIGNITANILIKTLYISTIKDFIEPKNKSKIENIIGNTAYVKYLKELSGYGPDKVSSTRERIIKSIAQENSFLSLQEGETKK